MKYEETVKVYKIGDFSTEVCGGPHVENTKTLGKFKIQKEEASSAGVRTKSSTLGTTSGKNTAVRNWRASPKRTSSS